MQTTLGSIGAGVLYAIKDTEDGAGVEIEINGTFRHGGMTHSEIEQKLKDCFCELDID